MTIDNVNNACLHALWQSEYVKRIPLLRSVFSHSESVGSDVEPNDLESIFGFLMNQLFKL